MAQPLRHKLDMDSERIFSKRNSQNFAIIWVSLTLALFLFGAAFYNASLESVKEELTFDQRETITEVESLIHSNLSWLARDIDFLSELASRELVSSESAALNTEVLTEYFLNAMSTRPSVYDQIRFLDVDGQELVRVNATDQGPYVVPENELQLKDDRYYFSSSITLASDEAYLSPLDLNVENEEIEMPFKPVIRIARPVEDSQGNVVGVLVLNQAEGNLLNYVKQIADSPYSKFWLLNGDGYWLLSDTPDDEWGFMLTGNSDRTLQEYSPTLWQAITQSDSGLRSTNLQDGLVSYQRLNLADDDFFLSRLALKKEDAYWYLVSISESDDFRQLTQPIKQRLWAAFLLIWLALSLMALWVVVLMGKRRRAYQELQGREAEMTAIFEHSPNAVVICDEVGVIQLFNRNSEKEFGYAREEVIGQPVDILVSERLRPAHRLNVSSYMTNPERKVMAQGRKLVAVHKSGNTFPVTISLNFMESSKGNYVIADVVNISEERALEAAQQEQEQLLIQQSKMAAMGQMLSAIAHQWRQPISVIGAIMMNLKDSLKYREMPKEEFYFRVSEVENKLQFMSQTIEDFRLFFKPDTEPKEFSVIDALEKAHDLLYPKLSKQKLSVELGIVGEDGEVSTMNIRDTKARENRVAITGSVTEFIQVLLNLMSNSIEAIDENARQNPSNDGQGRIGIFFEQDSDSTLTVRFEDNGGGISDEVMDNLFIPYFSRKKGGSGLGLYISQLIIEKKFHGSIDVASNSEGATFTIVVPPYSSGSSAN